MDDLDKIEQRANRFIKFGIVLAVAWYALCAAAFATGIYVAWHFISKHW